MSHLSELELSMLVDGALSGEEGERALSGEEHVGEPNEHGIEQVLSETTDETLRTRLQDLQTEAALLHQLLVDEAQQQAASVEIPKFRRPLTLRGFALANIVTGLTIWFAQFLWKTVFGELVMNATLWATSVYLPDIYQMASATTLYLLQEGTAMLEAYLGFVVTTVVALTILILIWRYRSHTASSLCVLCAAIVCLAAPPSGHALDIRTDEDTVNVPASETIDDTLLVAAETVVIEGDINGDLVAAGQSISVRGQVSGNLLLAAESIEVSGNVGGMVVGAASSCVVDTDTVGGNLWLACENATIDEDTNIAQNTTIAAETASIDGAIARDLNVFAENVEFSGQLGNDMQAFASKVKLIGAASIGGDVRFYGGSEDRLFRSDTVSVAGAVEYPERPEELDEGSRYTRVEFYLWQIAYLIAAFIAGLFVLWLIPSLRDIRVDAGIDGLKSVAIGFATLISVPVLAAILAFTIVGLPFTIFGIGLWLFGVYLSKILVSAIIGRMVLQDSQSYAVVLLVGLLIVLIVSNIPFIGGFMSFLMTILGLGLLTQYLIRQISTASAT